MTRRGMALPLALLALALLGALSGIVLLSSRVRLLSGTRGLDLARSEAAARGAVELHLDQWGQLYPDTLTVGTALLPTPPSWAGVRLADSLYRLGQAGFLLTSTAERAAADGSLLARATAGFVVRLVGPQPSDTAAIVALHAVSLLDSARVDGTDSIPAAAWAAACPPPAPAQPGLRSLLPAADCPGGGCLAGAPALLVDSGMTPSAAHQLGRVSVTALLSTADHRVAGTVAAPGPRLAAGRCDRNVADNWGDAGPVSSPCSGWFPVVEAADGAVVSGGAGQGVLIGSGRLTLTGGFRFTGIVVALGPLALEDSVGVQGLVLALDSVTAAGRVSVQWSNCAVMMSGRGSARPEMDTWGWFLGH